MNSSEAFLPPGDFSIPSNSESTQAHDIFPQHGKQNKRRMYTAEDWDAQRSEITRLYENNTLEGVMEFMREQYGLDAT